MTRTTRRITSAIGALAFAASGTFAFIATEENGANQDLRPLFADATKAEVSAKTTAKLIGKTVDLYRKGGIALAEDRYKAAAILVRSENLSEIHLAHDMSLAALSDGFLPAQKVLRGAQQKLLEKIGLDDVKLPDSGPYEPIERPRFESQTNETPSHVLIKPALPDATTTSMLVPIRPRF